MPKTKARKMFFGLAVLACLSLALSACSSDTESSLPDTDGNSGTENTEQAGTAPDIMDGLPPEEMGAGSPPPDETVQ